MKKTTSNIEGIIVIGGNHHNTLGVIRSLGYKGIYSNLILVSDVVNPYVAKSKYINHYYQVSSDNEAIQLLVEIKKQIAGRCVIIACSDGSSSALDLNKDILCDKYVLPSSRKQGAVTHFMNKELMSRLGESVGFNVPQSWVVESVDDITDVTYPCISKPILSKDGLKADIRICSSREELEKLLLEGSCYKYQVQEYIDKDFEYQLIGLSLNDGDHIVIPGVSLCIRPCPRTNTGFLKYLPITAFDTPLKECQDFVKTVAYSGLFSIEFLRGKDGFDYFMEMNFRNDGNAVCVTASGVNLPYIWYLECLGKDATDEINKTMSNLKPVYVMPEFDDFFCYVHKGKLSFVRWLIDLYKTDKFMEFDQRDIKPFLSLFISKIVEKWHKTFKN